MLQGRQLRPASTLQVMYMVKVAQAKYSGLMERVTAALEVHNTQRVAARVRRKQPSSAAASKQSVVSQPGIDVLAGDKALLWKRTLPQWLWEFIVKFVYRVSHSALYNLRNFVCKAVCTDKNRSVYPQTLGGKDKGPWRTNDKASPCIVSSQILHPASQSPQCCSPVLPENQDAILAFSKIQRNIAGNASFLQLHSACISDNSWNSRLSLLAIHLALLYRHHCASDSWKGAGSPRA